MHKRISIGLAAAIAVLCSIITIIITTAVTMSIYDNIVAFVPEREAMYSSLAEIDTIVRSNYFDILDEDKINTDIADGYIKSLNGINFVLSYDEYEQYKSRLSGIDTNGKEASSVSSSVFNDAGYIKIIDFTDNTPAEFKAAADKLADGGAKSLIIDVRDTDSINLEAAIKVIDIIVPIATEGTEAIATVKNAKGDVIDIFSADSNSINLPLSVIVNEKTSGAGELLACDIRDFGKGIIAGKTTKGTGTFQKLFELSNGGAVVLSVGKIIPYTSEVYDGTGIVPDHICELKAQTKKLGDDTQFLQAYAAVTALQK